MYKRNNFKFKIKILRDEIYVEKTELKQKICASRAREPSLASGEIKEQDEIYIYSTNHLKERGISSNVKEKMGQFDSLVKRRENEREHHFTSLGFESAMFVMFVNLKICHKI